jgi:dihydroorotate dehydrogenase
MSRERLEAQWETLEGEYLKTAAEFALHGLSKNEIGRYILGLTRRSERVEDTRLHVDLAGLHFENPVTVGAGWDKKGWAVDGLYELGFSGAEVGSVLLHPQYGNPRPRLWYESGVGLNRMGFNSPGAVGVANNLARQERKGVIGINISRNKLSNESHTAEDFAEVSKLLYEYADYFVINFQSPNTPGLRDSMMRQLRDSIIAVDEAQASLGPIKPIIIKTSVDMSAKDIEDTIQIAVDEGAAGIEDSNTTSDDEIKTLYGWQGEAGGLSGNDPEYRRRATERMKFITKLTKGTGLVRIGVGGISDSQSAIERIQAGAQIVQVVTDIRRHKAKTAININNGILHKMDELGVKSVSELDGTGI